MNQKKPLIGLTPYFNMETKESYMRPTYLKAISAAGGLPVILPIEASLDELQQFVNLLDGVIFTGGPDLHPFHFGEETFVACGNVSPQRDQLELALLPLVMKAEKPILGICRGMQLINVALGGDLYQDLPSQFIPAFPLAHNQPFSYEIPSHHVTVQKNTRLETIAHAHVIQVNSMHHQAVRRLAPGLVACGYSPDQLIESLEKPDYPYLLGVQWHPEYLWKKDDVANGIFTSFVNACMVL